MPKMLKIAPKLSVIAKSSCKSLRTSGLRFLTFSQIPRAAAAAKGSVATTSFSQLKSLQSKLANTLDKVKIVRFFVASSCLTLFAGDQEQSI